MRNAAAGSGASGAIDPLAAVGRLSPSGVTNDAGGGPSHGAEHPRLVSLPAQLAGQPEHLGLHAAGNRQAVRAHQADPQHDERTVTVASSAMRSPTVRRNMTSAPYRRAVRSSGDGATVGVPPNRLAKASVSSGRDNR